MSQTAASSPPLIGLFQVRVIKRDYRADGSPFRPYSQGTPNGIKVTILREELLAAGSARQTMTPG
jgi:hypothetical protein